MLQLMLTADEIAPGRFRPLLRREFDRLVELGVFAEDERIELVRGVLVAMTPPKPPHASATSELTEKLMVALAGRAKVRCQQPLAATEDSQPEPDISVVPIADYWDHHPDRAYLVVEVAYSSVRIDLGVKAGIYAEAGVAEYLVVNLADDVVEVFRDPAPDGYRDHQRVGRGEVVRVAAFPDVELAVDDVLGPRR